MNKLFNLFDKDSANRINCSKRTINLSKSVIVYLLRLAVLLSIGYIIIYPLFYMITTSIKGIDAYYNTARVWLPTDIDAAFSYSFAAEAIDYWNGLKSTMLFEVIAALIEVITCSIVAYGFARFEFKSKNILMVCLFLTILIPETMVIIPRMVNYSKMDLLGILGLFNRITGVDLRLNLLNSPLAFYLPSFFAIGLRSGILTFIYIQFFKNLPKELEEAAWVDGAGPVKTFVKIALPSSGVVFTTVIIFAIIWHWNDSYLSAMYLIEGFPLAVNLERIHATLTSFGYYGPSQPMTMSIQMAACVMFITPVLVMYMIMQRRFIESIDRVGITG
jgi:multiple sugar transport system permease protein